MGSILTFDYVDARSSMRKKSRDMKRICKLLDKLDIQYTTDDGVINIDPFYCDGAQDFWIKFYEDGSFQEFAVIPENLS